MAANVSVFFKERGGLVAVRGEGCFLVDEQGQRHLDTCNNVVSEWRSRWSVGASDTLYTYGWLILTGNVLFLSCVRQACVGHSHPAVVQAGQQALAQVQTNQRFLHPTQQRYVAKLLATFPPELNTVYLCNSGEISGVVAGLVSAGQCNTMVVMLRVCFED